MPDSASSIVLNTSPLIALSAALGSLDVLRELYSSVYVPREVEEELFAGRNDKIGIREFSQASFIHKLTNYQEIDAVMSLSLDRGESAVLQYAINHKVELVGIDEIAGRRFAKIYGIKFTGSLGILIKAYQKGMITNMEKPIENMRKSGIWISEQLVSKVIFMANKGK
ncbi:DUF3368 domain-containing protein [Kamptonema cortianum]|nr:DUF3368 domain-containing protein [Oscillatoria laete-virens]MDK3159973.1 DUF3368 domain-containing protein [Kamptonema cortianum]MDL5047186.1 DUF3368 domain-containing protein [Oscillatoria amoena NRMC-F 0135]MDL5055482.1 DUF3368 domain-containing protein [Oscillatoria laete-virens NRMC-F 0139]